MVPRAVANGSAGSRVRRVGDATGELVILVCLSFAAGLAHYGLGI